MNILIQAGANIDYPGRDSLTALGRAVKRNELKMVDYLLEKKAAINKNNKPEVVVAASKNHLQMLKKLLTFTNCINDYGVCKNTALHVAAKTGHVAIARYLISLDALTDFLNRDGMTPIQLAARYGHSDIVNILVEVGEIDDQIKNIQLAIKQAAEHQQFGVLQLLQNKINHNAKLNYFQLHEMINQVLEKAPSSKAWPYREGGNKYAFFEKKQPNKFTVNSGLLFSNYKKIAIITHADEKAFGDVRNAIWLQKTLVDSACEVEFSVKVIVNTLKGEFDEVIVEMFENSSSAARVYNSKIFELNLFDDIYNADLIILSPTPHFIGYRTMKIIEQTKKPVIMLTEYDFDKTSQSSKCFNIPDGAIYFPTGFSNNSLGVYSEKRQISSASKPFEAIHADDKQRLPKDLGDNPLYFGYFNIKEFSHTRAKPEEFILFALNTSENKVIDIIMPLVPEEELSILVYQPLENSPAIFHHESFMAELVKHKQVVICYQKNGDENINRYYAYQKDNDKPSVREINRQEFEDKKNSFNRVIRLFNPFPLRPKTVDSLMKMAHPVILSTGDQSTLEVLSLARIPFYQCVKWKKLFYQALIDASSAYPALYQWFKLLLAGEENITSFYLSNSENLKDEMKCFIDDIHINRNLSTNFLNIVKGLTASVVDNFKLFLNQLMKNNGFYASNEYGEITTPSFCQHLDYFLDKANDDEKSQIIDYMIENLDKIDNLKNSELVKKYLGENEVALEEVIALTPIGCVTM